MKTENNIDRVLFVLDKELCISKAEFCRRIGESTQTLNNWITRGNIPGDKLHKVSIEIGKSTDWILTGEAHEEVENVRHSKKVDNDKLNNKSIDSTYSGKYLTLEDKTNYLLKYLTNPSNNMEGVVDGLIKMISSFPNNKDPLFISDKINSSEEKHSKK